MAEEEEEDAAPAPAADEDEDEEDEDDEDDEDEEVGMGRMEGKSIVTDVVPDATGTEAEIANPRSLWRCAIFPSARNN